MSAKIHFLFITNVLILFAQQNAYSQIAAPDSGKFLATAGVRQVEGAGGGVVPWALITGYGTEDSYGANAYLTVLSTQDYRLKSYGVAIGFLTSSNYLWENRNLPVARRHWISSHCNRTSQDQTQNIW
jgi:hypothetical protein